MNDFRRPLAVDLFAGAGGLSLGMEQAGFDVAAAVELDPIHSATHEYNFPNCSVICADVSKTTGKEIRTRAGIGDGKISVVCGGAPCQGFSLIGKRSMDDPRNMLVFHFARIVAELEAPYFIFENVKGLTLGKHRKFLDEVIHEFESNGYEVLLPYKVLNAAQFGVPQERYRLFLIGARKGLQLPSYPQPTTRPAGSDTDGLYFPQGPSVWDAIGDLPKVEKYPELFERDFTYAVFKKPSEYARALRGLERSASDFGYPRINDTGLLTSSRRTFHNELSRKRFAETDFGRTEPVSRFHKLDPKGVCNTIRAGTASDRGAFTSPRPIHPFVERCITVREAARLHSYPDWFRFHTTKWHGFRQIGNSVPPLLARSVAAKLIDCIEDRRQVPRKPIPLGDPSLLTLSMSEAAARYNVSKTVIAQRIRTAETKRKREKQGVRIA